ncbi:hypothetical protein [Cylindrospermopsis raciborskii]|uniref:hypothetical protein n=1 Tax=Cylindrospermopsis raciborskii TaxID=77022 RepID=UPI0015E0D3EE|nr:hypothetical protein [Cylindrospermopsis raciborskii]
MKPNTGSGYSTHPTNNCASLQGIAIAIPCGLRVSAIILRVVEVKNREILLEGIGIATVDFL